VALLFITPAIHFYLQPIKPIRFYLQQSGYPEFLLATGHFI
jgi:hypothetical protein